MYCFIIVLSFELIERNLVLGFIQIGFLYLAVADAQSTEVALGIVSLDVGQCLLGQFACGKLRHAGLHRHRDVHLLVVGDDFLFQFLIHNLLILFVIHGLSLIEAIVFFVVHTPAAVAIGV